MVFMINGKRTWIATIVGLVAVTFVVWLSPKPIYKARGILLPAQQVYPPIPSHSVVQLMNRPYNAQVVGYLNIERHYPAPGSQAQQEIARLTQKLSAAVGANGFVVDLFRIGQVTSTKYVYVFRATAYHIPTVQSSMEPLFK